jgi:hypothetical protein
LYCWLCLTGTGKSTLVKFIIDKLNIPERYIAYVAYTGKASLVLQQKGCPGATTAHKLLYNTRELPDGTFIHIPKNFATQLATDIITTIAIAKF